MKRRFLRWLAGEVRQALAEESAAPITSRAAAVALRYHRHYQAGFLPRAGGIADQPAFLMACIEAVAGAVSEHEQLQMQDMKQRSEAGGSRQAGPGKKTRVLGKLRREDIGPGWRAKLTPV